MPKRKPKQIELDLRTWGGRRKGAGRKPKGKKAGISHRARPRVTRHQPVHVTVRVERCYRNLRNRERLAVVRRAFAGAQREGFRITDWSLQKDHIHLIAEANSSNALSRGMQGFSVRVARGLNTLSGRSGTVFVDRYHLHVLTTPREVRNALCYVLNNARHHGEPISRSCPDAYSSGVWFDGWRDWRQRSGREESSPVKAPKSWLRSEGWRKHGLIRVGETPGCR